MPTRTSFFPYSAWDAYPAFLGVAHTVFLAFIFFDFHNLSWPVFIVLGLIYSISISWSINGISHNFIHNPFFKWAWLNRAYSILLSVTDGFSQEFYHHVHLRHHVGNMDRIGENGTTIDPMSIYRRGKNGEPESAWTYTFCSYFRDDIGEVYIRLKEKHPENARWIWREIGIMLSVYLASVIWDWRAFLVLVPFYYFGHCLSSLNGFYEHYKSDPDKPIAWGVSTYNKLYNWLWLYNGYHAEHHYRPKIHWRKMPALRAQICEEQARAGVRVIKWCHALGFLDNAPRAGAETVARASGK